MPSLSAIAKLKAAPERIFVYIVLTALAAAFLFPLYWLAISAFKPQSEIFLLPPHWLPSPGTLRNFLDLYNGSNLPRAFLNSVIVSGAGLILSLFLCSLGGYAFAKFPDAPHSPKLFAFVLGTMLIPGSVLTIPNFLLMVHLHLIDTYWSLILPGAVGAFGIYWMRQYMAQHLPDELIQAARMDGCSEFGIYWRIALPIARPALAALGITQLIGTWNDLLWPFIMLRTPSMYTLPVVIYLLNGEERTPYGLLMAGGLLTTLPLVLAFLFFQRQFIAGITAGSIK